MGKYHYEAWCIYRDGGCLNRCLFGCHSHSADFDTPEQAYYAGEEAGRKHPTWDFTVVDETGARVAMGVLAPVGVQKKRKGKKCKTMMRQSGVTPRSIN